MKLDFSEIYDSKGEEEATMQLSAFQKWKISRGVFSYGVTSLELTNGSVTLAETLPPKYWDSAYTCTAFCHHQTGEGSFMIGASREVIVS